MLYHVLIAGGCMTCQWFGGVVQGVGGVGNVLVPVSVGWG